MSQSCHFEYSKFKSEDKDYNRDRLETYLKLLWRNRSFMYGEDYAPLDEEEITNNKNYQPFFRFDDDQLQARNFVGFVQSDDTLIEIFPKVFKEQWRSGSVTKEAMMRHLFYWFGYCRKVRFPFSPSALDKLHVDTIPELITYLFADTCVRTLSTQPYRRYEEVEEVLTMPRGRIDFAKYISNGLVTGNHHRIDCVYEPFVYDNLLNRGIKYVCRLLSTKAKFDDTKQLLDQVFFILDDVEDVTCTSADLERIQLNPLFQDYLEILDWCKRFLDQQLYSHNSYDVKQWSLLLPMEYIFEDFVAGFLEQNFGKRYSVTYQKSDLYLSSDPQAFNLQHDIFVTHRGRSVIVDTKYKVRSATADDEVKKGVDQSDMYQMVSYALRRGCNDVILCYPGSTTSPTRDFEFNVVSGFDKKTTIRIAGIELPFIDGSDPTSITPFLFERLDNVLKGIFAKQETTC